MQFLLLLSALLSAVTGAFTGPRAVEPQVSQSEAQVVAVALQAAPAQARAERPLDPCLNRIVRSQPAPSAVPAPIVVPPLTSVCLIE